jgi:hypothetical protein
MIAIDQATEAPSAANQRTVAFADAGRCPCDDGDLALKSIADCIPPDCGMNDGDFAEWVQTRSAQSEPRFSAHLSAQFRSSCPRETQLCCQLGYRLERRTFGVAIIGPGL